MRNTHSTQRGAALVMGLILLTVITLLAVVGMNIANTELAGATSDQLRMRAFNAAESGLEMRIQSLQVDRTTSTTPDIARRGSRREFAAQHRHRRRRGHFRDHDPIPRRRHA